MSHPGIANLLPLGFFMLLTLKWDKIQVCYQVTWPNGEIPLNLIMHHSINRVSPLAPATGEIRHLVVLGAPATQSK